jgi:hypothetical protein
MIQMIWKYRTKIISAFDKKDRESSGFQSLDVKDF